MRSPWIKTASSFADLLHNSGYYILVNRLLMQGRFGGRGVMIRIERIVAGFALAATASPALAGLVGEPVPAPVAGIGIGGVLLIGVGYRALKARMKK
jgi:hypothetical protein